jgi:vitamin B12/bleomycin/antimicrobial peptide transport system ATP-binding/permease protein
MSELESRITYVEGESGAIAINDLEIVSPAGSDMLKETRVLIKAGERVLIVGAPGTGKTLLFRALAGLWPWGAGTIARPKDEEMLYLPTGTPYLPRGSLKEVLAYPLETEKFPDESFTRSMSRLGLDRLVPLLNETRRWDRELSQDEQLGLALARIVMQAPPWLLIDDMLGGLDDQAMERVADIFSHELEHTSIIHIGRAAQARDPLFHRVLHLVPSPVTLTAIPARKAGQ